MDPLTMSLIGAAGTVAGGVPDLYKSKFERDQQKRLRELQRKEDMGALGLTDRERASIQSQMRGTRQQAQAYADAERARLTQPSAQPQMALLGQQLTDESRQRLEADLASQILGLDLERKAEQEQEIKDLEAAQAYAKRQRLEAAMAPLEATGEAYIGQMGIERLLGNEPQSIDLSFLRGERGQDGQRTGRPLDALRKQQQIIMAQQDLKNRAYMAGKEMMPRYSDILALPPEQQYEYMYDELNMSDEDIAQYFANIGQTKKLKNLNIPGTALDETRFGIYGGERGY